jgi:hypothetical protein
MMNRFRRVLAAFASLIILTSAFSSGVFAQCAMCRATLENNVSNGEIGMAGSLNLGILYLFAMPYLVVAFVAFVWYRKSRLNAKERSYIAG